MTNKSWTRIKELLSGLENMGFYVTPAVEACEAKDVESVENAVDSYIGFNKRYEIEEIDELAEILINGNC